MIEFCTTNATIENLDNYQIGRRLGQGAYAVVRLGLHKALNQKIAVKIRHITEIVRMCLPDSREIEMMSK